MAMEKWGLWLGFWEKQKCKLQPTIRTEDGFLELAHPRGIAILCPVHCSRCVAQGIRGISYLRCPTSMYVFQCWLG
ncbi:hypothetical protein Fmac_014874 [Flemingia macrophylla]|uniref:Uncharacterized protein n=1 Tax=Flemingia macrophylla TaxID=520843 RepID=A0ABD1MD03_9FABA